MNYGIAHGISGIILYLVNFPLTCQRNEVTKIKEICTKCINRLLDANNPNNGDISLFRRDEITRTYDTKLGWCQGDLSIGYMLSKVYTQFPDIVPVEKLNYILDRTLVRSNNENIADFCLCHGAIGISLLYYLQYKERTSENYLSMFTYWLKRAIELYQSGVRNPIYKEYGLGLGLLLGEVGIGLYLIGHFFSNRKEL
ncbi:lanthionine synthetase LanC family protein [Proteiniphilum acetatigenes]|uniref:lanthionine synthetase LanC family protein n=1 Tax=Proteiniphilum acetatigenes TaxID=294710 RepID=UPI0003A6E37C|nr:lanthionine synthetase LanC family protein [Proteiniphilum acetatigenes]